MENKYEPYVFKNSFMFVESSNLPNDIYMAFKDEIGYFLDGKYSVYLNEYCSTFEKGLSDFYRHFTEVLSKLTFILKDSTVVNMRQYVEDSIRYSFNTIKKAETNVCNTILREFDQLLSQLAFDIVKECRELGIETKRGVFSVINQYFEKSETKKFSNPPDVLEGCYGIVYETIRMLYGGRVGGKKF